MRRKEQEARIEQQRQEKEKAREDAARERARCAQTSTLNMDMHKYIQVLFTLYPISFYPGLKRPGRTPGCP